LKMHLNLFSYILPDRELTKIIYYNQMIHWVVN
jgi:hypothetical protein